MNKQRLILLIGIVIFVGGHLYQISAPPNGYHQWRESDTAAVALNYYQEDFSFLTPRINQRGSTDGATGMEMPIYNYTVAALYRLTGPTHVTPRLLTLFFACLGLWFFYRIVSKISDDSTARFATLAMAFSPLFFFYSYKIMPDVLMLTLYLGAIYFYLLFGERRQFGWWLLSALLLGLSAGIKPLGLSIYLPFAYLAWKCSSARWHRLALLLLYAVITITPVLLWMEYAKWLQQSSGLHSFYLGSKLSHFYEHLFTLQFLKKLFVQWPWELWIGWVLTPFFVYGLTRVFRLRRNLFYLVWIAAVYAVFGIVSLKASTHDYYTIVIVPPLAAISGIGLKELFESGSIRRFLVYAVLILVPLGVYLRIHTRFSSVDYFGQIRAAANEVIPRDERVIVEDFSGAIRFYQLNRIGWPLRSGVTFTEVTRYIDQGGRVIVLEKPLEDYTDSLNMLFDSKEYRLGPLYCYRLKE